MLLPKLRQPALIGLDIQPDSLRLIQLRKKRHGVFIERVALQPLDKGVLMDGKVKQWDQFKRSLEQLVAKENLKGLPVAVALPSTEVRLLTVPLPRELDEEVLATEIQAAIAEKQFFAGKMTYDYGLLSKDQETENYLITIAAQDYVEQCSASLSQVGLRLKIIDVDFYALLRAITCTLSLVQGHSYALVFFSGEIVQLIVFTQINIIFHERGHKSNFWAQLQQNLTTLISKENLVTIILYGGEAKEIDVKMWEEIFSTRVVLLPNIFSKMHISADVDASLLNHDFTSYTLAAGLALREVPPW